MASTLPKDYCHLDTRRMWPGCDDLFTKPQPLASGARTIGRITPKLAKITPKIFDFVVGNHVVQSSSEKARRRIDCGCISELSVGGYKCTDPNWYRVSQDTQGCHPAHREPWDLRRLLGNRPANHTNEMCSFRKSASCQQLRRRGRAPHTFSYRSSDTPLFAERDYDMQFWKEELEREINQLEKSAAELAEYTRELESALERTSQPLSSAVDCLDKHHLRNDYDQLRLDEVEDTLTEEKANLFKWREKLDHCVANAQAQIRRNCELGGTLSTVYHSQHLTKRVNVHTHEFYLNRQSRCTVPEEWLACVKETLRASRAERDKTGGMCAHVKQLLRESSNEIWQRFNVASNAINANIDRIHSERRATLSQLAMVERRIRETDRVLLMMRRSIRDKELAVRKSSARIDERARHLNMDVCSDATLADMKKEQQDICEAIKLTQVKMSENEKLLYALHTERNQLKRSLADGEYNLSNDEQCLPLRRQQPHTYDGPIIKIPFITS